MKRNLEINGIVSKEEKLTEAPKILDYGGVSKMRYYRDSNGDYYYLEEYGRKIYDDKVMEPSKDPFVEAPGSSSSFTVFSSDLKSYLYELVGRIFSNNPIREESIMAQIDSVTKASEES